MFTVTILEKGATEARRLTFDKEEVTIGRISGNDIILPKGNISKRHARLVVKDDKFIVIDLKSTNGTYVNKERISAPRVLTSEDKVYVGDFIMQLSGAGLTGHIPRSESNTTRGEAPPPPPMPPSVPKPRNTDHAPPATVLEDSEAATRAISLDELEAEAGPAFAAASASQVEVEVEPEDVVVDPSVELEIEVESEAELGEVEVPADEAEPEEHTRALELPPVPEEPEPEPEPVVVAPPPRQDSVRRQAPAPVAEQSPPVREEPAAPAAARPAARDTQALAGDDSDDSLQAYVQVLDELHQRAAASVFAELDPDQLELSDQQWTELEGAVGALVSAARDAGQIPDELDDATLTHDVLYEFTGLGPVEYFLGDDQVSRIYVNDFMQILVVSGGVTSRVFKSFSSPAALDRVVDKLAGALGFASDARPPVFGGELPDGTAFQVLLPPLTASGPVLSFSKPSGQRATLQSLLDAGALSEGDAEVLADAVGRRANIAILGRSAADRQLVLDALAAYLPEDDRVVVVEAHQSLAVPHRNVTRLRLPSLPDESSQLFRILRLVQAERVIVNGAAGADLASVLELAHAGTEGLLVTAYGRDARDGLTRLVRTVALGGRAAEVCDGLVRAAIDLAVHVDRGAAAIRITVEYTT